MKKYLNKILILLLVSVFSIPWNLFAIFNSPSSVQAASATLTSKVDFGTGEFNNTESVSKEEDLKL